MKATDCIGLTSKVQPRIKRRSEVLISLKQPSRAPICFDNGVQATATKFKNFVALGKNSSDIVKSIETEFSELMSHIRETVDIAKEQTKQYIKTYCPKFEKPNPAKLTLRKEVDLPTMYLSHEFESTLSEFQRLITEKDIVNNVTSNKKKLRKLLKPEERSFIMRNDLFIKQSTKDSLGSVINKRESSNFMTISSQDKMSSNLTSRMTLDLTRSSTKVNSSLYKKMIHKKIQSSGNCDNNNECELFDLPNLSINNTGALSTLQTNLKLYNKYTVRNQQFKKQMKFSSIFSPIKPHK